MPRQPYRSRQIRRADTGEVVFESDQPVDGNVLLRQALNAGIPLKGLDFTGLDLRGIPLKGQDLSGCCFTQTTIDGMDLSGCDLTGANLHWVRATGVTFDGAVLDGARLTSFTGTGSSFRNVTGRDVKFDCAELDHCNFDGADLPGANFELVRLRCGNMTGANLAGASFRRAKLGHAVLTDATLTDINFADASLYKARLDRATLYGSTLAGADMDGASMAATRIGKAANSSGPTVPPVLVSDRTILSAGLLANVIGADNLQDAATGQPFNAQANSARSGWHDFIREGNTDTPDQAPDQANDRVVLDFPVPTNAPNAPMVVPEIRPAYEHEREMADRLQAAGPPERPDGSRTRAQTTGPQAV